MESFEVRTQMRNGITSDPVSPVELPAARLGARLFSIGHSHHTVEAFVTLLRGAGVTAVADVRSSPYSRRLPQFNRYQIEAELHAAGIAYLFLGAQLGGRPQSDALFDEQGVVDYERVRQTASFQQGLTQLIHELQRHTVAMLCAEEDPLDCHRGLMIAPALVELGIAACHLRRDGSVETMTELEDRLLRETKLAARLVPDLFTPTPSRADVLGEAYRLMSGKKAYRQHDDHVEQP